MIVKVAFSLLAVILLSKFGAFVIRRQKSLSSNPDSKSVTNFVPDFPPLKKRDRRS